MKKKLHSIIPIALSISLLAGCGSASQTGDNAGSATNNYPISADPTGVDSTILAGGPTGTINVLQNIQSKYLGAASESEYEFGEPIYNLPEDYIFAYDYDSAVMKDVLYNEIFAVYNTLDFDNPDILTHNYASCSIREGKLLVEPGVVDKFYDIPESTVTADTDTYDAWKTDRDGTWGNLNKLYLVQRYDLETGEKLEKPIVTPFSIQHDVASTTLKQKIDPNNNYYLEWTPVTGASAYLVFKIGYFYDRESYNLVAKTTDTQISSDVFQGQLDTDKWSDIVNKELEENGYDTTTSEKMYMNSDLHDTDSTKFAVVAVKNGVTSGISNIVDSYDLADLLPYKVADGNNLEITINNVTDLPTFVTMTTVSDKTMQMLINYHGCTAKAEDEDSTTIYVFPTVYHTDLSPFLITVHGMKFSDFADQSKQLGERQDEIIATMPTEKQETEIKVDNVPDKENEEETTEKIDKDRETGNETDNSEGSDEDNTEGSDEDNTEGSDENNTEGSDEDNTEGSDGDNSEESGESTPPSDETGKANQEKAEEFLAEVADEVNTTLNLLQQKSGVAIDDVIYARSPMEEWFASCLMARSEYIPVPYNMFPEAADVDGTVDKLFATYRQNPTSGIIYDIGYSYDYQTYVVSYADDTQDRLDKTAEELAKAKELADTVAGSKSSDYDKVVALNDYFCENASYDEGSMSTDENLETLPQSFIDAHTPYGILCNNYGVCESYSEAMALTGRLAGLDVIMETGVLYGAGGHEWNRVSIDGNWCILDITNNDNDLVPNGLCNITDNMAKELLIPDNEAFKFDASATTDAYEYYHVNENFVDNLSDLADKLKEQLTSDKVAHVRCDESISEDDFAAVAQELADEGYPLHEGYYVFNIAVLTE